MKTEAEISKKKMLAVIKRALQLKKHPYIVKLSPEAEQALMNNEVQLRHAYGWAAIMLTKSDNYNISSDFKELLARIEWAINS